MAVLSTIITIILILVSIAMIYIVLIQKGSSGGAGAAFSGEASSLAMRGKSASKEEKLKKITIALAVVFGVLALVLAVIS